MKEQYRIAIPKPCGEEWGNMLPTDKGRHCLQCSKTVVDFSLMTDADVLAFLQKHKGKSVCGRLSNEQLDKTYRPVVKTVLPHIYRRMLVGLGLTIGLQQAANAQDAPYLRGRVSLVEDRTPIIISGTVKDKHHKPVDATIYATASGFDTVVATNPLGEFSIALPNGETREDLVIEVATYDYITMVYSEKALPKDQLKEYNKLPKKNRLQIVLTKPNINIESRMSTFHTGEVMVDEVNSSDGPFTSAAPSVVLIPTELKEVKPTFWQRLKFWK